MTITGHKITLDLKERKDLKMYRIPTIIITAEARNNYEVVYNKQDIKLLKNRFEISRLKFTSDYTRTAYSRLARNKNKLTKVGHLKYTNIEEGYEFKTRYSEDMGIMEHHAMPTETHVYDYPLYCASISNNSYIHNEMEDLLGYDIPYFLHGHLPMFDYEGQHRKVKLCLMRNGKLKVFNLLYYCSKIRTDYNIGGHSRKANYINVRHTGLFVRDSSKYREHCKKLEDRFFAEKRGMIYGNQKEYTHYDTEMHDFSKEMLTESYWLDNICCYSNVS